jgi:hypothetical protein
MPDLRDWILQRIRDTETAVEACPPWPWTFETDDDAVLAADGIQVAEMLALSGRQLHATGVFVVGNDPAAVLRRCAADRKILDIHHYAGGNRWDQYACHGCGYDDTGYLVDHANDCETLLALAEGYGLTDDERTRLDRPELERPVSLYKSHADWLAAQLRELDETLRSTTPTSDVPAALRGPNWKPRHTA